MVEIPRSFTLPGGYRVSVHMVTFERLQQIATGDTSVGPQDKVFAFYDDKGGRGCLYMVKGRHPLLLALDFAHEIKHAMAEWEDHWLRQHGVEAVLEAEAERADEGIEHV